MGLRGEEAILAFIADTDYILVWVEKYGLRAFTGNQQFYIFERDENMEPRATSELSQKGEQIFQMKVLPNISVEKLKGQIVAIDVETGEYYIDRTILKAGTLGRKTHPQARFYFKRIGYDALYRQHGVFKKRRPAE